MPSPKQRLAKEPKSGGAAKKTAASKGTGLSQNQHAASGSRSLRQEAERAWAKADRATAEARRRSVRRTAQDP